MAFQKAFEIWDLLKVFKKSIEQFKKLIPYTIMATLHTELELALDFLKDKKKLKFMQTE